MEIFKEWASTLCVTVIFISLAHILLPDSTMKNHVKFALSLILLAVMVIPIVKFLTLDSVIETSSDFNNSFSVIDNNEKEKNRTEIYSNDLLIENLEKTLNKTLKNEYPEKSFKTFIKGIIDLDAYEVNIDSVRVEVDGKKAIKKVEKITVNEKDEKQSNSKQDNDFTKELKNFISNELKIDKDKIDIVYM